MLNGFVVVLQELSVEVLQCLVRSRVLFTRITGTAATIDSTCQDLTPESTKVRKLSSLNCRLHCTTYCARTSLLLK
jgi:hypothetical protein